MAAGQEEVPKMSEENRLLGLLWSQHNNEEEEEEELQKRKKKKNEERKENSKSELFYLFCLQRELEKIMLRGERSLSLYLSLFFWF